MIEQLLMAQAVEFSLEPKNPPSNIPITLRIHSLHKSHRAESESAIHDWNHQQLAGKTGLH